MVLVVNISVMYFCFQEKDGTLSSRLVNIDRPVARIPFPAIHLHREMNDNLGLNKEAHLCAQLSANLNSNHFSVVISHRSFHFFDVRRSTFSVCRQPIFATSLKQQLEVEAKAEASKSTSSSVKQKDNQSKACVRCLIDCL